MALISKPYARYSVLPICVHLMIGLVHPSSEALPLRQGKYPSIGARLLGPIVDLLRARSAHPRFGNSDTQPLVSSVSAGSA